MDTAKMANADLLALCRASTPDDDASTKRLVVAAQTELFERQCGRGRRAPTFVLENTAPNHFKVTRTN